MKGHAASGFQFNSPYSYKGDASFTLLVQEECLLWLSSGSNPCLASKLVPCVIQLAQQDATVSMLLMEGRKIDRGGKLDRGKKA
jgi:hypothetical protein